MRRALVRVVLLAVLAAVVAATVLVVLDVTTPESGRPCTAANFDRRAWAQRGAVGQDPPVPRQVEADFLVACPSVLGELDRAGVRRLLGDPDRPSGRAGQARRRTWRYVTGLERGGPENDIDAEVLELRFGSDGRVRSARLAIQ